MEAMGVLTLRLCDHSLVNILQPLTGIVNFVTSGNLDRVIYQHGVMVNNYFLYMNIYEG